MKAMTWNKISFNDKTHAGEGTLWRRRQRWSAVLFTAAALGVFSGIGGLLVSGLSFFGSLDRQQGAGRLGTLLVVAAFPLVMLMAHALDKIDEIEKKQKQEKIEAQRARNVYAPERWRNDDDSQL